jgi:hypothetical protein
VATLARRGILPSVTRARVPEPDVTTGFPLVSRSRRVGFSVRPGRPVRPLSDLHPWGRLR